MRVLNLKQDRSDRADAPDNCTTDRNPASNPRTSFPAQAGSLPCSAPTRVFVHQNACNLFSSLECAWTGKPGTRTSQTLIRAQPPTKRWRCCSESPVLYLDSHDLHGQGQHAPERGKLALLFTSSCSAPVNSTTGRKYSAPFIFAMRILYNAYHNPYNYFFRAHLSHRSMIIAAP